MVNDPVPDVGNAGAGEGRIGHDRRPPGGKPRRQNMQRGAIFRRSGVCPGQIVAVGLVDGDHIGEFDEALLEALQFVAAAGQHQGEEKIRHVGDRGFRLSGADGLDQNHVVAGRLAQQHGLAGFCGDAAERAGRRRGADVGSGSTASRAIRVLSPRMEPPVRAEDGSTASTATLCPRSVSRLPSASMVVDLPTPGAPVMPTRRAVPV